MPPPPPVLMDKLVEEILLCLPPNDPVILFRAALVCKNWCRLIAGSGFRRRYREVHRMAPLLGFFYQRRCGWTEKTFFMCSSTFRLPHGNTLPGWVAVDTLQSRVLFKDTNRMSLYIEPEREDLLVLNPITGEGQRLPELHGAWTAALICATAGCNHLNCDNGPFSVICVAADGDSAHARVYSSEKDVWSQPSKPISVKHYQRNFYIIRGPRAHVGNAVFFKFIAINVPVDLDVKEITGILAYDQHKLELSLLSEPSFCKRSRYSLMATEDGKLGLTTVQGSKLYMWSLLEESGSWAQRRVIELNNLIPGHNGSHRGWMFPPDEQSQQVKNQVVALQVVPERLKNIYVHIDRRFL
ncbi:hypothetical protein EJB05_13850, partial [Eragrostis curvula]